MNEHAEYAAGLRQLADWIESHPEIDLPENEIKNYGLYNKEKAATVARAMGGRVKKIWDDTLFTLSREFGPIVLSYLGTRSNICQQVKVGTRVVPEQYVPPRPAQEAQTIPEHEEPVYEWRCAPLLQKPDVEMEAEPLMLEADLEFF